MELIGRKIILTGSASGIGRELLSLLSGRDASVVAADKDHDGNAQAVRECSGRQARIHEFTGDLSRPGEVDRLFQFAVERMGGADLLIANAGFAYYERLGRPDWDHIDAIFRANVLSVVYAIEKMAELNAGRPFHAAVTASSMGRLAMPGYALYAATKAALDRFAEGWRLEMPANARLTVAYPVATRTRFFQTAGDRPPVPWPAQEPATVAKAILRGIEHDRRTVYPSLMFALTHHLAPWILKIYQRHYRAKFNEWLARNEAKTTEPRKH